jgi:hypothetical protein
MTASPSKKPCAWLRRWFGARRRRGEQPQLSSCSGDDDGGAPCPCPRTYDTADDTVLQNCILTLFRGKPRWEPRGWDFVKYEDPRDNAPEPYHSTEEHYQTMVHFARTQELFHFPNTSYYDLPRRPLGRTSSDPHMNWKLYGR